MPLAMRVALLLLVPALARHVNLPAAPPMLRSPVTAAASPWCTFTNSTTTLTLATPIYTLALSASTGSLQLLTTGAAGGEEPLLLGSAYSQLWAMVGPSGSLNNNALPMTYSYAASADGGGALVLQWARAGSASARVTIDIPSGARFYDATFELLAPPPPGSGAQWDSLWFPSMPLFNASRASVFFPVLPGLALNASFFAAGQPVNMPYPGSGVFAELLHINATGSGATVSLFTISGPTYTIPHFKGLYPAPANGPGLWRYAHSIQPMNVSDGCDVSNGGWRGGDARPSSAAAAAAPPCALGLGGSVRVRTAIGGTVLEDVLLYSVANGLAAAPGAWPATPHLTPLGSAPLPPLLTKLSGNASALQRLARAPLVKVDAIGLGLNFSQYGARLLPALAALGPGLLLHSVAWEPVRFDHFYPDLLPPNVKYGTGCELQAATAALVAQGHLHMPYSNPTWWDPVAPTLAQLPPGLSLAAVASHNASGQPIYETYPDTPPAMGVVMEQVHSFVSARVRALLCQLDGMVQWPECSSSSSNVVAAGGCNESAVRLNSAVVFEDQLGARNAYADRNELQGGLGALGYQNALERHSANVTGSGAWAGRGVILGTEQGYDRMATSAAAFFGNNLEISNVTSSYPFYGLNWAPLPAAGLLLGPTLLYAVHNLATAAFAHTLPNACWALATGARLSIDGVEAYWQPQQQPWLGTVAAMQRVLVSQWTGYALVGFEDLRAGGEAYTVGTGATLTSFARGNSSTPALFAGSSDSYAVASNWANAAELQVSLSPAAAGAPASAAGSFSLPARGCMAYGGAGDVVGGWVSAWRGRALTPSAAAAAVFVAEDRNCAWLGSRGVCLRMRLGVDSALEVAPLPGGGGCGGTGAALNCTAVAANGSALGAVPCTCGSSGLVTVSYTASVGGSGVVDFVFVPATAGGGSGGSGAGGSGAGESPSPAALGGVIAGAACAGCGVL